jgi:predicted transcriptional regulator
MIKTLPAKKHFTENEVQNLIKHWKGQYSFKKTQGLIESITFSKRYLISNDVQHIFISRLIKRDFISFQGEEREFSFSIIVKPQEVHEFKMFCKELEELERRMLADGREAL